MLLSYADRTRAISAEIARAAAPVTQESISTFTVDGFVAGTWRVERERGRGPAHLAIRPLSRLGTEDATALADEGAALLAFLAPGSGTPDVRIEPL